MSAFERHFYLAESALKGRFCATKMRRFEKRSDVLPAGKTASWGREKFL